uniref:Uncharacterized protein n=1 Tax=Panagrolaimus sp. JU765 TaxID=591449 RepID=A0AC34QPT0_9BILA
MLESFIQTQKASIMRQMRKTFAHQLTFKKRSDELLLYILKQLIRDQLAYEQSRAAHGNELNTIDKVVISEADFKMKARQLHIENQIVPFYRSKFFTANHFTYDSTKKAIIQVLY